MEVPAPISLRAQKTSREWARPNGRDLRAIGFGELRNVREPPFGAAPKRRAEGQPCYGSACWASMLKPTGNWSSPLDRGAPRSTGASRPSRRPHPSAESRPPALPCGFCASYPVAVRTPARRARARCSQDPHWLLDRNLAGQAGDHDRCRPRDFSSSPGSLRASGDAINFRERKTYKSAPLLRNAQEAHTLARSAETSARTVARVARR